MNRLNIFLVFIIFFNISYSQDTIVNNVSNIADFNRWSVELNLGQSKGVRPFTDNYYSSNPRDYFNLSKINHYDLGFRYMFNEYFGTKVDFAYDLFQNEDGSGSLPFKSKMYSIGLQGVMNVGRVLHFDSFTNRFGLLAHAGVKISQFTPEIGGHKDVTEDNGGIVFGLTPQFRVSNRFALSADFTALSNMRQHYNWDGVSLSNKDNNLTGLMYTASFGLTYYIGNRSVVHADWYSAKEVNKVKDKVDEEARKRLDELETLLSDVDKDGVPDYLDFENNTPGGVAVDTRGRFIDMNKNNVPDELEDNNGNNAFVDYEIGKYDAIKSLVENGYLNIFFDLNSDVPNESSSNNLLIVLDFMKKYPDAKIKLLGYADTRGGKEFNIDLSSRRSRFVYNYLVKNGVSSSRLSVDGRGVDSTYVSDNKELDYRMARRVAILLIKD